MSPLTAARAQMEISLGFHMIFAALGIALPLLMLIAEGLHLRTGQPHYLRLCRTWAKATALLFAVGAVSGTALSFELGLLWPRFMEAAGSVLGPAFALEGYAFFIEAIFIGLYLYGWDRLSPRAHFLCGVPVALSGLASGILVVAANAWMQVPVEYAREGARLVPLTATAVFRTPVWLPMAVHTSLACYVAVGFAVAGVYAGGLLRGRRDAYHRSGLRIALLVGAVCAFLQIASGDRSAKAVAAHEPVKLAAMEAVFRTEKGAPLLLLGWPDVAAGEVRYAIRIPKGLSFLAKGDFNAEIAGLEAVPPELWPSVPLTHLAFQIMVLCGFALAGLGLWSLIQLARRRADADRWLLRLLVLAAPLGFIALEAGWIVTEVGRQPFIIRRAMFVSEGVTPVQEVGASLWLFTVLYLALGAALVYLLLWLRSANQEKERHAAA
jgi:cytochrome d ubiquinol oxidase subunit I